MYVNGAVAGKPGSFCRIVDAKLYDFDPATPPPFPTFLPEDAAEDDPTVFYAPKAEKDPML